MHRHPSDAISSFPSFLGAKSFTLLNVVFNISEKVYLCNILTYLYKNDIMKM